MTESLISVLDLYSWVTGRKRRSICLQLKRTRKWFSADSFLSTLLAQHCFHVTILPISVTATNSVASSMKFVCFSFFSDAHVVSIIPSVFFVRATWNYCPRVEVHALLCFPSFLPFFSSLLHSREWVQLMRAQKGQEINQTRSKNKQMVKHIEFAGLDRIKRQRDIFVKPSHAGVKQ